MSEVSFKTAKLILTISAASLAMIPHNAFAQDEEQGSQGIKPPPSIVTNSPGGVDMTTGAYSMQSTDLQIGNETFPNGLTLSRSYYSASGSSYSGFLAQGWSHNWLRQISGVKFPTPEGLDLCSTLSGPSGFGGVVLEDVCFSAYFNVSFGNGSAKYQNGANLSVSSSNIPGVLTPLEEHNKSQKLEYIGNASDPNVRLTGYYIFTDTDGTENYFNPLGTTNGGNQHLNYVIAPNGVRADISYSANRPKTIFTSNGYALIFEYDPGPTGFSHTRKACVVNLATTYVESGGDCPANALAMAYDYSDVDIVYHNGTATVKNLSSATNALGEKVSYQYDDGGHVDCIIQPGQSQCQVRMTYTTCIQDPYIEEESHNPGFRVEGLHLEERVLRQDFISGEYFDYKVYRADGTERSDTIICANGTPYDGSPADASFVDAENNETRYAMRGGKATSITDPLNRQTKNTFTTLGDLPWISTGLLTSQILPEGNKVEIEYNNRGLVTESRLLPKPDSSDRVLTSKAKYPDNCTPTTRKTCNKPLSTTDAKGNVTTYTYAPEHGGVLSVKGPAVNGVAPETRYTYAQQYAWLKSNNGSFVRTDKPFWILSSERSCINSAMTSAGTCAGGASDLVVTNYQYQQGSASQGSNVWLLGTAVTSNGKTLRTCYGYDAYGRRISETQPKGTGGTCP